MLQTVANRSARTWQEIHARPSGRRPGCVGGRGRVKERFAGAPLQYSIVKQLDDACSACAGHASSPLVHVRLGVRRSSGVFLRRRGVRNDRAFHRARGAMCEKHMARVPEGTRQVTSHGRGSTPAFRTRMDFAACSMSRGLSLAPTRPVRASCRPDMHLDRPPDAPASVPGRFLRITRSPLRPESGIVAATRIPLPRCKDDCDAPLTGAGQR